MASVTPLKPPSAELPVRMWTTTDRAHVRTLRRELVLLQRALEGIVETGDSDPDDFSALHGQLSRVMELATALLLSADGFDERSTAPASEGPSA